MPIQRRRRLRLFWPPGYHMGPWNHPIHYGPPPGWSGCGWNRPTNEEEKEYLDEYIAMLKEELAAEEYRKELEGSE
jgi:hypothetical protein